MNRQKYFGMLIIMLFALVLAGCSEGPSSKDIKGLIEQDAPDFFEVKQVKVLNTVKQQDNFRVEFETTFAFTKSYADLTQEFEKAAEEDPMAAMMGAMMMQMLSMQFGEWTKGQTFSDKAEGVFAKGKQGWMYLE